MRYAAPGYVLIESPEVHNSSGQYMGKVIGGVDNEKFALYFLSNGGRVFFLEGKTYHSIPLSNILIFWDVENSDQLP